MSLETIEKYTRHYHFPASYPWLREMVDEVEREVAERYMRLPVDADGEVIHIGDAVYNESVPDWNFEVGGFERFNGMLLVGERINKQCDKHNPDNLHHVKRPTVEDVIYDIAINSVEVSRVVNGVPVLGINMDQLQDGIEQNADKLREAVMAE